MIAFTANSRCAHALSNEIITSGSIGIPVEVSLSPDFDGLQAVMVFQGSGASIDVILPASVVVPHEVVASSGGSLKIGVYARNQEGTIAIPTVWACAGFIEKGCEPSDIDPSEPTPDWTAQVQAVAQNALDVANGVKAQADAGDFDGADGVGVPAGGYTGQVLAKASDDDYDTEWVDQSSGGGAVSSVNGQTGDVVLSASDVGALPDNTSIPTKTSQLQNDSGFITSAPVQSVNNKTGAVTLTASDVGAYSKPSGGIPKSDLANAVQTSLGLADGALQKSGGTMTGAVAMGGYKVTGLGTPQNDGDASTKKYVDDAIAGIGTVFTIKGDVAAVADLPSTGNTVGDVYYVQSVSAAYVWLETTAHPTGYWEEFGEPIDLSGYIEKPTSPTANQYLKWNGSAWVAADAPVTSVNGSTGAVTLSIPSSAGDVGAVAVAQGVGHAGEFLVVGSDGNVTTVTLATWQGGSF